MAMFVRLNFVKNGGVVMVKIKKIFVLIMSVCFFSLTMTAPIFASSGTTVKNIDTLWSMFLNKSSGATSMPFSASPNMPSYGYQLSAFSGSGYVTNYIHFNGLPKNASYKLCIDYTVGGSVSLKQRTGYGTGYSIDYMNLMHQTSFIYYPGEKNAVSDIYYSATNTGSGSGTLTFTVTDNTWSSSAITVCHYCDNISAYSFTINRIYFITDDDQIVDSLDNINNASSADKQATDAFTDKSNSQSQSLNNSISSAGDYDKPDGNAIAPSADDYIDTQSVSSYNNVLGLITNNNIVITMLLSVCSIALIGYVLFGKR